MAKKATPDLNRLRGEYRPSMDKEVLHSWAQDVVAALAVMPAPQPVAVKHDDDCDFKACPIRICDCNFETTPPAYLERLREENERLTQRLNHYIKATTDKNSDLIAAEARVKVLEEALEAFWADDYRIFDNDDDAVKFPVRIGDVRKAREAVPRASITEVDA